MLFVSTLNRDGSRAILRPRACLRRERLRGTAGGQDGRCLAAPACGANHPICANSLRTRAGPRYAGSSIFMLEAINLSKSYNGTVALDALNLRIEPGEIFCLLGANGAGKTTTINLFLNFIPPSSGTAKISGLDVVEKPLETKKYLAYIPEQVMLYRNLTGLENLEYFTSLAGERYSRQQLLDFLKEAGLPTDAAEKRVGAYSKGMRQK